MLSAPGLGLELPTNNNYTKLYSDAPIITAGNWLFSYYYIIVIVIVIVITIINSLLSINICFLLIHLFVLDVSTAKLIDIPNIPATETPDGRPATATEVHYCSFIYNI